MARRNLLRSLLAASVMVVSSTAGLLVAIPTTADAADDFIPDYRVTVYEIKFSPSTVYARPGETVQFNLAPGVSTNHTVTLENGTCGVRPTRLCERNFDDPNHPPIFRFSNYGEYRYYDRIAREAGQHDMGGVIVIMDNPPPTTTSTTAPAPSTTSTTQATATTTTTRPVTTTLPPTSTTTAPSTIRPFVIAAPPTTTTTTAVPGGIPAVGGGQGSSAGAKEQSKGTGPDKGKDKDKRDERDAPTTPTSGLPNGPIDVVFDEASLTPLPDSAPIGFGATSDSGPEEAAALVDLLNGDEPAEDERRSLLFVGIGVLAALALGTGFVAWFRRSSRYFPA